jgi:uncharacterized YccA/Bax inhibitor family protein
MLIAYNTLAIEMNPSENLYLFGIFIGALIRTFAPFIRKFYAGEVPKFEFEYVITFIVSLIISALVAFAQFIVYPLPEGGQLLIFAIGLGVGVGSNTLINEAKKWFFPDGD